MSDCMNCVSCGASSCANLEEARIRISSLETEHRASEDKWAKALERCQRDLDIARADLAKVIGERDALASRLDHSATHKALAAMAAERERALNKLFAAEHELAFVEDERDLLRAEQTGNYRPGQLDCRRGKIPHGYLPAVEREERLRVVRLIREAMVVKRALERLLEELESPHSPT